MHPILFEAVYLPAFIKAANARGRVFKDVEDLGQALVHVDQVKTAAIRKAAGRVINADVGLDQIISHMKKAKAKKALAGFAAGA